MVMPRLDIKPRSRCGTPGGQAARAAVAYLVREGDYAPRREVGYLTREQGQGKSREDLVWREVGNLPIWAKNDPYRFFQASYDHERANGRWGMAIEAALPRELTQAQQKDLAQDFARAHLHNHAYLMVQHQPVASDGEGQPHIHVLFSSRQAQGGLDRQTYFSRQNPKDDLWRQRACPSRMRQAWADLTNYHLERAGQEVRVDLRGLRKRGIERASGYVDDPGKRTYASQTPAAKQERAQTMAQEQSLAYAHWEERKRVLGITNVHALSREAMAERSREWVRDYSPGRQLPERTPTYWRERGQEERQRYVEMEQTHVLVLAEGMKAQAREQQGRMLSREDAQRLERIMERAQSVNLIPRTPGHVLGRGLGLAEAEEGLEGVQRKRQHGRQQRRSAEHSLEW